MYFNKKNRSPYCIILQINRYICVPVDCKSDSKQGKAKVFIDFQEKKN